MGIAILVKQPVVGTAEAQPGLSLQVVGSIPSRGIDGQNARKLRVQFLASLLWSSAPRSCAFAQEPSPLAKVYVYKVEFLGGNDQELIA